MDTKISTCDGRLPKQLVHFLLFIIEYSGSADLMSRVNNKSMHFFLGRDGGLHLFLLLINAYYNKPAAGRRPGWVFTTLRERIRISERALRILISDAVAEGHVVLLPAAQDKRYRSYSLAPSAVSAWEELTEILTRSMDDIFGEFDAGALANVDYHKWNPDLPAAMQRIPLPPSRALGRK